MKLKDILSEMSQHKKINITWPYSHKKSKKIECTKAERRQIKEATEGRRGIGEMFIKRYKISVSRNEVITFIVQWGDYYW